MYPLQAKRVFSTPDNSHARRSPFCGRQRALSAFGNLRDWGCVTAAFLLLIFALATSLIVIATLNENQFLERQHAAEAKTIKEKSATIAALRAANQPNKIIW